MIGRKSIMDPFLSGSFRNNTVGTASYGNDLTNFVISGSFIGEFSGTASYALSAPSLPSVSASYALSASYSDFALNALSASYAPPSPSVSASYALSSSYSDFALSASYAPFTPQISASYALSASHSDMSNNAISASYSLSASYAKNIDPVISASYALSSSYSGLSNSASYATTSSYTVSASYSLSSSYALNTSPTISSSYALSSSYSLTASYSQLSTSASYANNATSSSYAINATSASYALSGLSASYATSTSYAENTAPIVSASYALSASYANNSQNAVSASYILTASYANNALTASYSNNSTTASYALISNTASYAVNPNLTNNVNNYVVTATGGGALNGEANLTFDGTILKAPSINTGTTINGVIFAKSTTDITLASTGHAITFGGESNSTNGVMGEYSTGIGIQARNNGAIGALYLNPFSGDVRVGDNIAGVQNLTVFNKDSGTTSFISFELRNNAGAANDTFRIGLLGTGFTPSGMNLQNAAVISTESNISGGLSIGTKHASGSLRFYTNSGLRYIIAENGHSIFNSRIEGLQASLASANDLTLGNANCFLITGTTTINAINTGSWQAGSIVYLSFAGNITIKNNTAGGAGTAPMRLAGSVDFSATADDELQLRWNGTNWKEVSRTVI